MFNKLIFLHHVVIQNNPGRETLTAGLGPIGQYGFVLLVFIIVVVVYFIRRKKKKL